MGKKDADTVDAEGPVEGVGAGLGGGEEGDGDAKGGEFCGFDGVEAGILEGAGGMGVRTSQMVGMGKSYGT